MGAPQRTSYLSLLHNTMTVAVYTHAFESSDCCMGPFWRCIFSDGQADRYICRVCYRECDPVPDFTIHRGANEET